MRFRILAIAVLLGFGVAFLQPSSAHAIDELIGSIPRNGGLAGVVWSGGPVERIAPTALERGCAVRSVWGARQSRLVGYLIGAPPAINQEFLTIYPGGEIPPRTVMVLVCEPGGPPPPVVATVLPPNLQFVIASGVSPSDEQAIRAGTLSALQYLQAELRYVSTQPVKIDVNRNSEVLGFPICCVGGEGGFTIATAHPDWAVATVRLSQLTGWAHQPKIAAHEFVHVYQAELGCIDKMPIWMAEGMAENLAFAAMRRSGMVSAAQFTTWFETLLSLFPLSTPLSSMEDSIDPDGGYELSALAIRELLQGRPVSTLRDFCLDLAGGKDWKAAVPERFGRSIELFYADFENYRKFR
ncbi:MAG: hypothetical protein IT299_08645 [Dehalococcoidia bacterium]|nr:hypothetical protein [Dehalococcoidia bacterium]